MREAVAMWRNTRLVVLTAVSASLYAAILIPFKVLPLIPGVTELRPANAVPVVCSFLFGPAGAWGAAGAAAASTGRPYWVQVGAFRDLDAARRLATLLTEPGEAQPTGASPVVILPDASGIPLARVRIGPFFDRAAAAAKLREMEGLGHRPFLAREGS